jgi:hypothetical protein
MTETQETTRTRRPDGPNPGILGIVSLALTILALVVPLLLAGGRGFPSPLGSTSGVARYFATNPGAVTAGGFFTFGASVPLGIYAATVYARMLRLGIRVPGPGIAYFGGISASILLATAGLFTWVLGQPVAGQTAAVIHTVAYAAYAIGGVGFVGGVGLLIAGIAVPTLILRLAPRWMAWTGVVLAAICELGFLSLLLPAFSATLPIGRFAGLAWLITIGFMLPRRRHEVPATRDG